MAGPASGNRLSDIYKAITTWVQRFERLEWEDALKAKAVLIASAVSIWSGTSVQAASPPRSVDTRTLDVAGVKTGMDLEQARAAAANHFHIPPSQIKPTFTALEDPVSHKTIRVPRSFEITKDGATLSVDFVLRTPIEQQRPFVVERVRYAIAFTKANIAEMSKAAVAKYGEPTYASGMHLEWCDNSTPKTVFNCNFNSIPALYLSGADLVLTDPVWSKAYYKLIVDSKSKKPSF